MDEFLRAAIEEAERGFSEGGIPIGSVLVHRGRILGRGHNRRVQKGSAILHGEMDALENAGRQPARVYRECTIYTMLSPCVMCSGSILLYGIPRVIVGENRTFLGEEDLLRGRGVKVEVLDDARCQELMTRFIQANPASGRRTSASKRPPRWVSEDLPVSRAVPGRPPAFRARPLPPPDGHLIDLVRTFRGAGVAHALLPGS
jgi:cytosine deaminase